MNRRHFLARATAGVVALAAFPVARRRGDRAPTILGVSIIRHPLPVGRQAKIVTFMGFSAVAVSTELGPAAAARATALGVFYALRDRPRVGAIEENGFYWHDGEDENVLAARAARHDMTMCRWGASS